MLQSNRISLGIPQKHLPSGHPQVFKPQDSFVATVENHWQNNGLLQARPSSREVRIRVPFSSLLFLRRGTLPQKRVKGHYWDLASFHWPSSLTYAVLERGDVRGGGKWGWTREPHEKPYH